MPDDVSVKKQTNILKMCQYLFFIYCVRKKVIEQEKFNQIKRPCIQSDVDQKRSY